MPLAKRRKRKDTRILFREIYSTNYARGGPKQSERWTAIINRKLISVTCAPPPPPRINRTWRARNLRSRLALGCLVSIYIWTPSPPRQSLFKTRERVYLRQWSSIGHFLLVPDSFFFLPSFSEMASRLDWDEKLWSSCVYVYSYII